MKKLLLLLLTAVSVSVFAQSKEMSIQGNANLGQSFSEDYGGDIYSVSFSCLFTKNEKFYYGGGASLGSANLTRCYSPYNLLEDDEMRDDAIVAGVYGRVKLRFSSKPTAFFAVLDAGYNVASLEDYSGDNYNPLGFYVTPALGVQIDGTNVDFIVKAGLIQQLITYNEISYSYSSILERFAYDSFILENFSYTGLFLSFGIAF